MLQGVKEPHGYISSCKVGTMCPDPKSFLLIIEKTETDLAGRVAMWDPGPVPWCHGWSSPVIQARNLSTVFRFTSAFLLAFPSGSPFILLGRRCNSHLMFLPECFAVGLRVYTQVFGCQIQLPSVGSCLSKAAQGMCWICQACLGG